MNKFYILSKIVDFFLARGGTPSLREKEGEKRKGGGKGPSIKATHSPRLHSVCGL